MSQPCSEWNHIYISDRGMILVYHGPTLSTPVVTVEAYCKWYNLYVVRPTCVSPYPFAVLEAFDELPFVDHVPNPAAVEAWAEACGYHLDEQSHEMMIGRWQREVTARP